MYSNIVHKNTQLPNFSLSKNGVGHVFKYCAQKHPAIEIRSEQKRGWAQKYTAIGKNGVGHVFKY